MARWGILITLLVIGWCALIPAAAQEAGGAVCVTAFNDTNQNGVADVGEAPLAGVNVNLATGGAIIATHITAPGESLFCFEPLRRGEYTVTFTDAPTYRSTTPQTGTFGLDTGQHLTIDPFGAFPVPVETLRAARAAQAANTDEPLDPSTRLLLATVGATMVMLFMVGAGAVILALWSSRQAGRRRASYTPPPGRDTGGSRSR